MLFDYISIIYNNWFQDIIIGFRMAFSHMDMTHIGHIYHPFTFYCRLSIPNPLPFMLNPSQFLYK